MNYGNIIYFDSGNSHGLSTTVWVSGCEHHCPYCFNSETWDFNYGKEFSPSVQEEVIKSLNGPYVKNLVISGGDPLHPKNRPAILAFIRRVKRKNFNINIIIYTGYKAEDLAKEKSIILRHIFREINWLIDGRFEIENKTKGLDLRGSTNQQAWVPKFSRSHGLQLVNRSAIYFNSPMALDKERLGEIIECDVY